jgi:hypothetical protein
MCEHRPRGGQRLPVAQPEHELDLEAGAGELAMDALLPTHRRDGAAVHASRRRVLVARWDVDEALSQDDGGAARSSFGARASLLRPGRPERADLALGVVVVPEEI